MFKYRFAPYLRFLDASLQPLRVALEQARVALDNATHERNAVVEETRSCEQILASLPANTPVYLAALRFVRELHLRCRQHDQLVQEAEAKLADATVAVNAARSRIRQLEKHRERQQQACRAQEQKHEYRAMDEAWLQRLGTREGDELRFDR